MLQNPLRRDLPTALLSYKLHRVSPVVHIIFNDSILISIVAFINLSLLTVTLVCLVSSYE